MRRIEVDFNTLNSAPIDMMKFHTVSPLDGTSYEDLQVGDQVELYEPEEETELRVRATISGRYEGLWLATPDFSTLEHAPLATA